MQDLRSRRHLFYVAVVCAVMFGQTLVVSAASVPRRVVSLAPSITEMLYAIGAGSQVVGISAYCNYPAGIRQAKAVVGTSLALNEERLLTLKPDLILSIESPAHQIRRMQRLTGAPVQVLTTKRLADVFSNLRTVGHLTGRQAQAEALITALQTRLAGLRAGPKRDSKRVFYMVWHQPLMGCTADSYLGDLIAEAGATNVVPGGQTTAYPVLSDEFVIMANPDVILGPGTMRSALATFAKTHPGIKAVREHQIKTVNEDLVARPGPRVVEAVIAIREALDSRRFGGQKKLPGDRLRSSDK